MEVNHDYKCFVISSVFIGVIGALAGYCISSSFTDSTTLKITGTIGAALFSLCCCCCCWGSLRMASDVSRV